MLTKYVLKVLAISCSSVKLRSLSKLLDRATLGHYLKVSDSLYLSMYFSSHSDCFGNNL